MRLPMARNIRVGSGPSLSATPRNHARARAGRKASECQPEQTASSCPSACSAGSDLARRSSTCALRAAGQEEPHDPRLLVVESEFARILAVSKREGSTLSTLLRQAWDGGRLQVRSRGGTAVAEGAHLVVIGHITKPELLARVAESDIHGGLLNRFLIVEAERSKLLPSGGNLDDGDLADFNSFFRSFVTASTQGRHHPAHASR